MFPENLTSIQIQSFLLILIRITAMLSLLPVFGSQNVPIRLKVGFSFLLAIILSPLIPVADQLPVNFSLAHFIFIVIKELFIGITIGFASTMLFASVQFAGRLVDTEMGFALVQLMDPFTNAASTVTGQFQVLVYSIVFLLINGHFFMLMAIKKSFEVIPLMTSHLPSENEANFLIAMIGNIFILAIRLAAPILSVLILTSLSLGIIARTVPQINIFFVGLPLKIFLGITTLAIVLPGLITIFRSMVEALVDDLWRLLYLLA